MLLKCLQCEHEFEGIAEWDELGLHSSCPACGGSFDVDADEYDVAPYDGNKVKISVDVDEETPMSATDGFLRVDWSNIGEGYCGDFDEDDPEDENLLRFDVYVRNPSYGENAEDWEKWDTVEDASYCTLMPATADKETLEKAIRSIFAEYRRAITQYPINFSVKKMGETLSWIGG